MDTGQFFSGTIQTPGVYTPKGLVIRVGENGEGALCYDTELLRVSAGWTGGFLTIDPARYGIIVPPKPAGDFQFSSPVMPGFAKAGSFADPRTPNPGGTLPRDWAHYKGLYLHGNRVVLSYTIGDAEVLESPWIESNGNCHVVSRTFEFGPSRDEIKMVVCDANGRVAAVLADRSVIQSISIKQKGTKKTKIVQDGQKTQSPSFPSFPSLASVKNQIELIADEKSPIVLRVAPHSELVRLKLLIWSVHDKRPQEIQTIIKKSPPPTDLKPLTKAGRPRWTADITTLGIVSDDKKSSYVIDTLTLPFDNPYKALMFTSGHDFFSNGNAAVCTLHGDVWIVSGIDDKLERLIWKRFATGLFQPLGLKIVDDQIYVVGRDQITRLHDRNNDGEADFYENFNNEGHTSFGGHEYVTCLETDSKGNFYYVKGNGPASSAHQGCLLRVSKDGSRLDVVATGFRNPNGMAIGPNDEITVAPQEGEWTPGSAILWVKPGGFYGFVPSSHREKPPTVYDPPLCWLPRRHDNSSGGQVWVNSERWGPLNGQLLHFSFGQSKMMLVLREQVDAQMQGGTINFPLDFDSGVMRGRFRPQDGQLYVTGLKGWVSNAVKDGCFQRVRYTGVRLDMPVAIRTLQNGIAITFSQPLDRAAAEDPDNFNVEQWNYRWSQAYGSPEFKVSNPKQEGRDSVEIQSATLLDDRTVFLEIEDLKPVMQMGIGYSLKSNLGIELRQNLYVTINKVARDVISPDRLTRSSRPGQLSEQIQESLRPGLILRYLKGDNKNELLDTRRQRMAAISFDDSPALTSIREPKGGLRALGPPDPFTVTLDGYIRVPLKDEYDFYFEGKPRCILEINGRRVLNSKSNRSRASKPVRVTLHKGYNHIHIRWLDFDFDPKTWSREVEEWLRSEVEKPSASDKSVYPRLRLFWKGRSFPAEPVPPTVLFCNGRDPDLLRSEQLRRGRELFATRYCFRCHVDSSGSWSRWVGVLGMDELDFSAPNLSNVGVRLNRNWLFAWLLNPSSIRNHVGMPDLLNRPSSDLARQHAADLTEYLMTMRTELFLEYVDDYFVVKPLKLAVPDSNAELKLDGEYLYEDLGCMSCHRLTLPNKKDEFDRTSLHYVGAKFQPGLLNAFLATPERHYKSTRMPNFRLNQRERAALATFLRKASVGTVAKIPQHGDAKRGKQLFESLRCNACHDRKPDSRFVTRMHADDRGCMATNRRADARTPNFRLNSAERNAIASFLKFDPQFRSLFRTDLEASSRFIRRLNCIACHDRDAVKSSRRLILAEEGSRGLISEVLPNLTWSGEKLHNDWMWRLFQGRSDSVSRSWLKARMPAFPVYAHRLADGLVAEHGYLSTTANSKQSNADPKLAEVGRKLSLKNGGLDCDSPVKVDTSGTGFRRLV